MATVETRHLVHVPWATLPLHGFAFVDERLQPFIMWDFAGSLARARRVFDSAGLALARVTTRAAPLDPVPACHLLAQGPFAERGCGTPLAARCFQISTACGSLRGCSLGSFLRHDLVLRGVGQPGEALRVGGGDDGALSDETRPVHQLAADHQPEVVDETGDLGVGYVGVPDVGGDAIGRRRPCLVDAEVGS
ncbi:hypothetical protein [Streptomyces noursei]|uniref:hypothetical protein n=1 Tax=Streptomyces noursei TaxID=1971 RepID=UPI00135207C0